ncbi:MAG: hypothetical protein LBU83_13225 [Bacteroidales bacterium]|jgi:hypothetical protein|nr:hypothetical protein [Bacteroidales bacterium]
MAYNAQHIAEVAASTHFPTSNGGEISNYFQTTVMPQFWQYACCTMWLPSHDIVLLTVYFLSNPIIRIGACVSPKPNNCASNFLAVRVCNMVFMLWLCGSATRYCKRGKATVGI